MLILGIESSCDETAVALVRDGSEVVGSLVSSQIKLHAPYGGVIPEIAAREHLRSISPMFDTVMRDAGVTVKDIDLIAVTQGPGLVGALLVGVSFAKAFGVATGIPVQPVNHVHAHVHGALLGIKVPQEELWPTLSLVVSGGHTNLYWSEGPTSFELLAHTADDACGECFDKVGKLLELPFPGGPQIERAARGGTPTKVPMPRMVERKSQLLFSYSGLKTAVATMLARESQPLTEERRADICAAFQAEALGQIIRKLETALKIRPDARRIVVAGGVAANAEFRRRAQSQLRVPVHFPDLAWCSDNAAMIAALGYHLYVAGGQTTPDPAAWDVFSRYPFEKSRSKAVPS